MSKKIQINSTEDVNNLLDNITNSDFSEDFIFNNQKLRNDALTGLGIDIIEFEKNTIIIMIKLDCMFQRVNMDI